MAFPPHLTTLLTRHSGRVLALGWQVDESDNTPDLDVTHAADIDEAASATAPFAAIVWNVDRFRWPLHADRELAKIFALLADEGRVYLLASLQGARQTRQRGSLPSRHEVRLRSAVRIVSESGFVIRRDYETKTSTPDEPAWKTLVAMRDPFVIRSYQEGDEAAILGLFRTSFHHERGREHWQWKYVANPYGGLRISLAFASQGDLAAHYAGYPIPVWRDDGRDRRSFLALQMGDTMTHEAFRDAGRGKSSLLARTVRHFFSIHRNGTFGFYFGFNTGPIQRFCRWFIGGSQTIPVSYHTCPLPIPERFAVGGYRVDRVEAVGEEFDELFQRLAPAYGFLVRRDAEYVDWRYLKCPDTTYVVLTARRWGKLVGWSVFSKRDAAIAWGDALFLPRHALAARAILQRAVAEPELAGTQRIDAWFPTSPDWWSSQLGDFGFTTEPEPQGLGMVALADTEPEAFARLDEELYYTMGDGDLF